VILVLESLNRSATRPAYHAITFIFVQAKTLKVSTSVCPILSDLADQVSIRRLEGSLNAGIEDVWSVLEPVLGCGSRRQEILRIMSLVRRNQTVGGDIAGRVGISYR
jgi:hypothetical protein